MSVALGRKGKYMKILILANSDVGLFKFRRELLEKLTEHHQVYVSVPDGGFVPDIRKAGCKVSICRLLDRRSANPLNELKLLLYYCWIVKRGNLDMVLTYTIKPNVYGGLACRWYKTPYVANITGLGTAVENRGFLQKITLSLYKCGLKEAKKVFFQNTGDRDFFLDHRILNGSYDLLPGSGVNINRFPLLSMPDCGDGKSGGVVKFAFISRIMKEKGIEQYLAMAEEIKKIYPATEFHVCGFCEDKYEGRFKELIEKKIVYYHGMIRDVSGFMGKMHCIVHPTYYPEGLSNVLLEACSSGRPVITTDRNGCREVVDDGINGYLVPERDSKELVKAVKKFLALPWERKLKMGLEGRRLVEREFDRQIVVNAYMQEIENGI